MTQHLKLCLGLTAAFLGLVSQASGQVNLTLVKPAEVQPLSTVTVTGTLFPTGTIAPSAVTVTLSPFPGGGGPVTTVATAVTVVLGSTRQISFRVPASLASATPFFANIGISGATATGTTFSSNQIQIAIDPPATISNVSQGAGTRGTAVSLAITGSFTHFLQGSTVLDPIPGLTCPPASLVVQTPLKLTAGCDIDAAATPGLRDFSVTTGTGATAEIAALTGAFLVSANNALSLSSLNPATALQGQTYNVAVVGINTHFAQGVTVANFSDGVVINSVAVSSATQAVVNISIDSLTYSGYRPVTIVTGGEYAFAAQLFSVGASPAAISSITPNSGQQGQTFTATVAGTGTHWKQDTTKVAFGPIAGRGSVIAGAVKVLSPTSLTVDLTVDPASATGLAALTVATGGEIATLANAFTVIAATPYITSVVPASALQGRTLEVNFTGRFTNFQSPATATFGTGVTVNSVVVSSLTTAKAGITIGALAPTGAHAGNLHTGNVDFPFTFNVQPSAAAITSALPNSGPQGASIGVTVIGSGTHFVQGTTTASIVCCNGNRVSINRITVNSALSATIDVTIPPNEPPVTHTFSVVTGGESLLVPSGFSVVAATPTLTMTPSSGGQGTSFPVEFTGQFTSFLNAATTANITGTGVTLTNFAVNGPTSASAIATVSANAPLTAFSPYSPRVVTLTTGTQIVTTGFAVTAGHYISSISPNFGALGQTLTVSVQGVLTHFVAGQTTLSLGPDIAVSNTTVTSPTTLSAQLSITNAAALGWRTAFVNTGTEYATAGFRVDLPFNATLTSVSPASAQQGQSLTVNILGQYTNFQQGVTQAILGAGITVNTLTVNSPTSATAQISVSPTAYNGLRTVSILTGTEVVSGLLFSVKPGIAILSTVMPPQGVQGQVLTVAIAGLNTHFLQGLTTASVTGGVTVTALTINSPTTATAQLSIANNAQAGLQTIALATAGETAVLQNGFTIGQAIPTLLSATPASGNQGDTFNVVLLGSATHWSQGTTTASFGAGIVTNSVTVADPVTATANITISPTAFAGLRNTTITTLAEVVQLSQNFSVTPGAAVLTLLSPNRAHQGDTVTVHVTGQNTHFLQGATLAGVGLNINVGVVTVLSPTSADVVLAIGTGAVTGLRAFTMSTGGENATISSGFTVQPGIPTLNSAAPNTQQQGLPATVTLLGQFTHFQQGVTTVTFGQGIVVGTVSVLTPTSLTAAIAIDPIALTGSRSVTVTTGGEIVSGNYFSVAASPAILSSISPNTGAQGQTADIQIAGQGTHFAQGLTGVSLGVGIVVNSVVVNSPLTLTANITIASNATIGPRTVSVSTGGEQLTQNGGFNVNLGNPLISSVNPNSAKQGDTNLNIQITGQFTAWAAGSTVSFGTSDIAVGAVTVNSPTSITAVISVSPTAVIGPKTLTVTTGAQQLTAGFTVSSSTVVPTISYAPGSPVSALAGQTLTVSFNGTGTHFSPGTTTASFGPGITVNSVQVLSATQVNVTIAIDPAAAAGPRAVTIATGGESAGSTFQIVVGTPSLTVVNPTTVMQGDSNKNINITGQYTTFAQGVTAANFGPGITVNSVTVNGPYSVTVNISADLLSATGTRAITISTGSQIVAFPSFLVTASAATLSSVAPSSAQQNATLSVVIAGISTHFAQGVTTANFGSGITVNSLTVNSATQATANVTLAALAATGPHSVTLTTQGEIVTLSNGFIVTPGTAVLLSLSPLSGQQQMDVTVAVLGQYTNWVQGQTAATLGTGVTILSTTVTSPTSLQILAHVTALAALGLRDLTVSTGAQVLTLSNSFTVAAGPAALSLLVPATAKQGDLNLAVAITGVNTNFGAGTAANFGQGVAVNSFAVVDTAHATANISVSPTAAVALNTVTLTTQGETASRPQGFSIQAATPILLTVSPATVTQGQTANIAILGSFTNFVNGTTTANLGAGITVNSVTVADSSHATVNVTVAGTAATGARDVTVTTNIETVTKLAGINVITGAAVISSLTPATGRRGQTLSVALVGTGTNFTSGTTSATFSGGIAVNSLTVNSLTSASANITIDPAASLGLRAVTLTTGGEIATLANAFTVNAALLQITTATLPNPTTAVLYTQTVATSGGSAPFTFSLASGTLPPGLTLAPAAGTLSGTPTTVGTYTFDISVTDSSSQTAHQSYTVIVSNALTITTASLPSNYTNAPYALTIAAQGGVAPLTFSLLSGTLPGNIVLSPGGALTGTPTLAGTSSFTIRVTDSLSRFFDKTYSLGIYPPFAFTSAIIPNPRRTAPYTFTLPYTGGIPTVTFSLTAGFSLPAGLSLNSSTGVISGTPTLAGTTSVSFTATDALSSTVQSASIAVDDAISITTATLPNGFIGAAYNQSILTANGVSPIAFAVTLGTLPTGLNLNPATGAITGTPLSAQTSTFTVQATDSLSLVASQVLTLQILPPPVILTIAPSQGAQAQTLNVTVTGQNTNFVNGTTTANFGIGVTVNTVTVNSLTVATVNITVAAAAAQGSRAVTLTTGSEIVTSPTGFSITGGLPAITSLSPAFGKKNTTVSVTVVGTNLLGATFALKTVDPSDLSTPATLGIVSNTGTVAVLTLVLGPTEGQFPLVAHTSLGDSSIDAATQFLISPTAGTAVSFLSILNTNYDPTINPPFPAGRNTVNQYVSILNTSYDPTANPPFPPGHNTVNQYISVLNTQYPTGNSSYNVAVGLPVAVCNRDSGCTAVLPGLISHSAQPKPAARATAPSLPSIESKEQVIAGQTLRLHADDVPPGATVMFEVNRIAMAQLDSAPYETLFTVPENQSSLTFRIVVRAPHAPEFASRPTTLIVNPDRAPKLTGRIADPKEGVEIELAAGGLQADFYTLKAPVTASPHLASLQPVRTGYVSAINQPNPGAVFGDDPLGVQLPPDYAVKFTGEVWAEIDGEYVFSLEARSGATLSLDGREEGTAQADTGFTVTEPHETKTTIALNRGWHKLGVVYYHAVGTSSVRLQWQQPGQHRQEVVGPEVLRTVLQKSVTAESGNYSFPGVPQKLDSIWLRVKQGETFTEYPALTVRQ